MAFMQTNKSKKKAMKRKLNSWGLRKRRQPLKGNNTIGFKNVFGYLNAIEKSWKILLENKYFKEAVVLSTFQLGALSFFYSFFFIVRTEAQFLTDQRCLDFQIIV